MSLLLKLKHWQLFMLTWGPPILVNVMSVGDPGLLMRLFPVTMLFFMTGVFGWIWAISTRLHEKLADSKGLNLRLFKIVFSVPVVYLFVVIGYIAFSLYIQPVFRTPASTSPVVIGVVFLVFVVHLASMGCIFYGIGFAAKTLKSVELRREARVGEYLLELLLIWMNFLGVWIIQPRLNALMREK